MSYFFKSFFSLFLASMTFCVSINAQDIKRLDTNEGLINGTINKFSEDSLGYLWIGTDKGINRYSGVQFKKYDLEVITSQESNGIIDILNLKGDLFMISPSGSLIKYLYEFDTFKEILHIKREKFLSIAKLNEHEILISLSSGFIIYDVKNNESLEVFQKDSLINRKVVVDQNKVYVATPKGCYFYNYDFNTHTLNFNKKILVQNDILDLALDYKNRLWVGTELGGLYIVDNDDINKVQLNEISSKNYAIRKIKFDKKNNALIAIDRLGLLVINEKLEVVESFSNDVDDSNSISQNSIYEIFVDDSNAYWLGLREGGINIIYQKDNVFKHIKHILNKSESINNNNIRSVYETSNGDLWFGTENGLSKYSGGSWTNYNKNPQLFNTAVLTINQYKNDLLIGTYGQGILKLNKTSGVVSKNALNLEDPLDFIFNISVFNDHFWISGSDGPLMHYYDGKLINKYPIRLVRSIVEGYDGINYAGSNSGFFEINNRNKSIRKIKPEIFNSINEVQALEFDALNNTIWIGSIKGLYKFNLSTETLENISQKANNEIGTVFSIKKDNMQNLYLGSISGLWRYNIKNQLFRKFDAQDGLFIKQFGAGASGKLKDGRFVFGGPEGAVIFNPYDLEKDKLVSNIYISDFQVNGKKTDSLTLSKNINYLEEIELNYDQNSISFNFETIKFHGSKRNIFEWKLEGYDNESKSIYGSNKITYSNLKPGNYELQAVGYNADGEKGNGNYSLKLKIKNPFWKTWIAFVFYTLFLGIFIYLLIRITKANIRKRTDEDRIKFFVEVAHDIRTPVSLIQLLVKQLSNQEDAQKSIELIQRNTENLNEYVTQLLDFQKIDRNQLKLSVSKIDLKVCLSNIVKDFTPILQKQSLDIQLDVKNIPVWFDELKMNRIFYNLISNAIKYSNEGGQILIKAFIEREKLKIAFIDDGIGIPEKQQDLIFKRFTRGTNVSNKGIPGTGIGLMLSKKIIELHGGEIILESKENVGSTFTIVLPLGTEHYKQEDLVKETESIEKSNNVDEFLHKNKLILLVEDTLDLRKAIKNELDKNYTVIEASNGKEGLLIALSKSPDLIITDVMMPEMNGKELCNLLKTNFKTSHIPVIMLTALVDVDNKLEGLQIGADAYVEKPFNLEILKATINNLIKSRENVNRLLEDKDVTKQLSPDERFLSDVIETIKNNLTSKDFSVDTLCENVGLSRSNLFRKLKGLIQMSPSDLIIKIKLNHAEELMKKKTHTRISDIAYESGFNDPKYFSTLFKKYYQQTPKEFIDSN